MRIQLSTTQGQELTIHWKQNKIGTIGPYLTIKPKISQRDYKRDIPGPGTYFSQNSNLSATLNTKLSHVESSKEILNHRNKFNIGKYYYDKPQPNPSTYYPDDKLIYPSPGKWKFGTSTKSEFLKEVAWREFEPGPNRYDQSPRK